MNEITRYKVTTIDEDPHTTPGDIFDNPGDAWRAATAPVNDTVFDRIVWRITTLAEPLKHVTTTDARTRP